MHPVMGQDRGLLGEEARHLGLGQGCAEQPKSLWRQRKQVLRGVSGLDPVVYLCTSVPER